MDAILEIKNIGFLKGSATFKFKSGKLNIVEAPNRLGKSTIIKSLAAILSLPCKSDLATNVAIRLGLLDQFGNTEPMINVGTDNASIRLSLNGEERICLLEINKPLNITPQGDEKFLLTGILSEEGEITRRLRDGSGDFSWIVSNLSLAEEYEKAILTVEKELNESKLKLDEIKRRMERLEEVKEKLQRLYKEKDSATFKLRNIEAYIAKLPFKSPELEKTWNTLQIQEQEKRKRRDLLENEIASQKSKISVYKKEFNALNAEIKQIRKELEHIEMKFNELPSNEEIKSWEDEIRRIDIEEIPKVREDKARIEGYLSLFESAMSSLQIQRRNVYEIKCPVCGKVVLKAAGEVKAHYEEMRRELSILNNKIAQLIMRKNELLNRKKELEDEREKLEEVKTTLRAQLGRKESEINRVRRDLEALNKSLEPLLRDKEELEKELAIIANELKSLSLQRAELSAEERKVFEERGETINLLDQLQKEIARLQEELSENFVERIDDHFLPIEVLRQVYQEWIQALDKTISSLKEEAKRQRREAAQKFNQKIKDMLWKLGFTDFEDLWLDEETYILHIIRKKGQRAQAPSTLSTSEKHALATLLQLAVKDAYMPENRFLVIDEVVLDFDPSRFDKIMNYLSELAMERDWFIIMTKLGDVEELKVRYL